MTSTTDVDYIRFTELARTITAIASANGTPLSEEYDHLVGVSHEAQRVAREMSTPAPISMPTSPAKVTDHIKKAAALRSAQRDAHAVATELATRAEREATRVALAEGPRVTRAVKARFDQAAQEFLELAPSAPVAITSTSTADEFSAHQRMLTLVETLNTSTLQRVALAPALGEELRTDAQVWLVLAPDLGVFRDAIRSALTDYAETLPASLEDWLRLTALGATMASPGEAQARAARFAAAMHAAGYTSSDGGIEDRTYRDMLAALQAQEAGR